MLHVWKVEATCVLVASLHQTYNKVLEAHLWAHTLTTFAYIVTSLGGVSGDLQKLLGLLGVCLIRAKSQPTSCA